MNIGYEGYDQAGQAKSGFVEAATVEEAVERMRRQGIFVTTTREVSGTEQAEPTNQRKKRGRGVSPKLLAQFARELSVLVSTGTPIADAIASLERQAPNEEWRGVVRSLSRQLEEGESLSSALEAHTGVFDPVFRSLVAAGESSGQLEDMLHRVSVLTRRAAQIRSNVLGAMAYPILLTSVCLIVLVLMLGVVLPRFSGLFETLDTPLPATTQFLVALSGMMIGYWWVIVPAGATAIGGIIAWLRTGRGTRSVQTLMLKVPKVGAITRSFATARIARLMGTLLQAKVPMMESIELTRRSISNHQFRNLLDQAEETVTRGEPISSALSSSDLFVPSAAQAVRNGESTGRLAEVLIHVADYLEEENESVVKSLSSLLEPLIMIVLGGLVAFVAISMFMPLFDLTAAAGGPPA